MRHLSILPILLIGILLPAVPLNAAADEHIRYSTGTWDHASLGNHRAVVRVEQQGDAVRVRIPWRRRDLNPELKNVIVVDANSGQRVDNIFRIEVNREFGDLVFQPTSGPGDYFVYYMPQLMHGRSNYPTVTYPEPEDRADPAWLSRHDLSKAGIPGSLPTAKVVEIQSKDKLHSFYPMEVIATAGETEALLAANPEAGYLLFPEDRRYPIKMSGDLPQRWIDMADRSRFGGKASRGEFYAFQVGVFAARSAIEDIDASFSDLEGPDGFVIPADSFSAFNLGGIDWTGKQFDKVCAVEQGQVQALWFGVQIPPDAVPGKYNATLTIAPAGLESSEIALELEVGNEVLADAGDDEPWRHSRLRWLDSRIADDTLVAAPFTPLAVDGATVQCLGRSLTVGTNGLPANIVSNFTPEMTGIGAEGRQILSGPMTLVVEDAGGKQLEWQMEDVSIERAAEGLVTWSAKGTSGQLLMAVEAKMEFDGTVEYQVTISSSSETEVRDIRLEVPIAGDVARYMMGMGFESGLRPDHFQWKWDERFNQDSVWIGDVNAGAQYSFSDENYIRPLNTNFYHLKPLRMPPSWYNGGLGGCEINTQRDGNCLLAAYSGERKIAAGEELHFNFRIMITPFKCLDTRHQFETRYYHRFEPLDAIAETGANTINVHHATDINPFLNYPFLRPAEMKAYVDDAHARGMKVKIYYTVRELSNRAPELFALRSLGDEILAFGAGGGFSWLQEHLVSDYIGGWFVPENEDATVINSGVSRWHNYFLEGLDWLVRNVGIDGIYIDDVAFDRHVMKRVRKILDRGNPGSLIDLHSANQFNPRDGYAGSANLYLEHFPYLDRLWFGEYFDYDSPPEYWLVEISGIPFGLMGEMLEGGGNPWRGMLYGMTARLPWAGDPRPLWRAWDDFGITGSRMIGYWAPACPVRTDHDDVLATVYLKEGTAMVSLASWASRDVEVKLKIDWEALGIDPEKATITAPEIADFQPVATFTPGDAITVPQGKGCLLIISEGADD